MGIEKITMNEIIKVLNELSVLFFLQIPFLLQNSLKVNKVNNNKNKKTKNKDINTSRSLLGREFEHL